MIKILLITCFLFSTFSYSQETEYKEYSYSELFKMIEEEKDSVFVLKDAIIKVDSINDHNYSFTSKSIDIHTNSYTFYRKDTITIDKELQLENVQFFKSNKSYGFYNMIFNKKVILRDISIASFVNCEFNKSVLINHNNQKSFDSLRKLGATRPFLDFDQCIFKEGLDAKIIGYKDGKINNIDVQLAINNSTFYPLTFQRNSFGKFHTYIFTSGITQFSLDKNTFIGEGVVELTSLESIVTFITDNSFENTVVNLNTSINEDNYRVQLTNNTFKKPLFIQLQNGIYNFDFEWSQLKNGLINSFNYDLNFIGYNIKRENQYETENINLYINEFRIKNKTSFKSETKLLGDFYTKYKKEYDTESANLVYTEIKDLETQRSEYLYQQTPSFKTFFKWRINQFLKVFSAYGTEPERAVIISLYVILFFAFIYLLFPNSWDSLGKKRLIHRFEFFQKYLRRKDGMHTIYLEENAQEISSYEDFKTNLESSKTELPAFFITWSKPLYNASMFSSRLTSRFLKNTDILKGKWTDLSPKQKRWKNFQIGLLLTLGLLYDLFIKALNALMLSINTFTTLGFGEIPIKGLPRYLAIIQGFIGWFMLTIFSVSLISQLLN